jgi:hypothetical protein
VGKCVQPCMQDSEAQSGTIEFVSKPKPSVGIFLPLSQLLGAIWSPHRQTALMSIITRDNNSPGRHKKSFSPIEASVLFNAGLEKLWEGIFPTFSSRSGSIGHWSQFMPASGHLLVTRSYRRVTGGPNANQRCSLQTSRSFNRLFNRQQSTSGSTPGLDVQKKLAACMLRRYFLHEGGTRFDFCVFILQSHPSLLLLLQLRGCS